MQLIIFDYILFQHIHKGIIKKIAKEFVFCHFVYIFLTNKLSGVMILKLKNSHFYLLLKILCLSFIMVKASSKLIYSFTCTTKRASCL